MSKELLMEQDIEFAIDILQNYINIDREIRSKKCNDEKFKEANDYQESICIAIETVINSYKQLEADYDLLTKEDNSSPEVDESELQEYIQMEKDYYNLGNVNSKDITNTTKQEEIANE